MLAHPPRGLDALVGVRRGHTDVGEHDVGGIGVDEGDQLVERSARSDHLEMIGLRQEPNQPFAQQNVVLCEHKPNQHASDGIECQARRQCC